ncbi:BMP family ABC transporter substrate-binding protein [bacterium]|nr:BMP family ABC transporter substrate-binding protein [bacterium]
MNYADRKAARQQPRRRLIPGLLSLAAVAVALLCSGCPPAGKSTGSNSTAGGQAASGAGSMKVQLVFSDLGLEDGYFGRLADEALSELADAGSIAYSTVGTKPEVMKDESAGDDVGLPPGSFGIENKALTPLPGMMTQAEAEAALQQAADCELLVLSAPSLVAPALQRISAGDMKAEAILLLDNNGYSAPAAPAVPVYSVSYDIRPVAFLTGVAAAASSNTGMFMVVGASTDPQANDWLDGVAAGAKYRTNGARVVTGIVQAGDDGLVSPDEFLSIFQALQSNAGAGFRCNHYILTAGRATPSIMYALSKEPTDGYCLGGYGDFRPVRPARFVGCALKRPDNALRHIFSHIQGPEDLQKLAAWNEATAASEAAAEGAEPASTAPADSTAAAGSISVGLAEGAVDFTDFDLYARFNPDGDDIQEAVESVYAEIKSGEFDYLEIMQQFKELETR